jgi:hypothetical protein
MPSLIPEDLTQPGTHALIIGVSAYQHFADGKDPTPIGIEFEMEQLSAAARSASEFAAWLLKEYRCDRARLCSLRVLLSPTDGEQVHPDIGALLAGNYSATTTNVKTALMEFRNACNANIDNVAIVYVAGHGVQLTKSGAIVLLQDFGDAGSLTELERTIDMAGVHAGMNHPKTARTQFWFVDACRQKPAIARRFENLNKGALTLTEPPGVTEVSPLFLAAGTGKQAYARVGGITLFCEALLWALRGNVANGPEAGINRWHVPVTALIKQLPDRVNTLAAQESVDQSVDIAGKIHEAIFHEYVGVPKVNLHIDLSPQNAWPVSKAWLKLNANIPVVENFSNWPLQQSIDAGLYLLDIKTAAPFQPKTDLMDIKPPSKLAAYDVTL